jgi:hypothetical protein
MTVTPQAVEQRLVTLSRDVDEAHTDLVKAEQEYANAKSDYEIAAARARLSLARAEGARKLTVAEREDEALLQTQTEYRRVMSADALVRAARANAARLRTQVDIARSVGTSVRTEWSAA